MIERERDCFENNRRLVKFWSEIKGYLPEGFKSRYENMLKVYFRAQLRYAKGQEVKGKRIMKGLVNLSDYEEFEEDCIGYMYAVDLAVRGFLSSRVKSRIKDFADEKGIEPAFLVGHKSRVTIIDQ